MTQHLKRFKAPKSWGSINVKTTKYIISPNPGRNKKLSLPLGMVMRKLALAQNAREIKKILTTKNILINGRKAKDAHTSIGLFDVLSIPELNTHYRIMLDQEGTLELKTTKNNTIKPCKIINKTILQKGKLQINLLEGINKIVEKNNYHTNDTLILSLPDLQIINHLPLQKGANILVIGGRHVGKTGTITNNEGQTVSFESAGQTLTTTTKKIIVTPQEL